MQISRLYANASLRPSNLPHVLQGIRLVRIANRVARIPMTNRNYISRLGRGRFVLQDLARSSDVTCRGIHRS